MLSEAQIQRYSRHILLREVGGRGQQRLMDACVRIESLNDGGRAAALWLARAGVGALVLPEDESLCPDWDPAGLLLHADQEMPMTASVRRRLPFHAPHLVFEGQPGFSVAGVTTVEEGILAVVSLVRQIVGDSSRV